ncbi:glycosyltransferase family 87 protein [Bradyrhizobium sp. 18BD]
MGNFKAWTGTPVLQRFALYLIFVAYGVIGFRNAPGDDLSSSYVGCRLLAAGRGEHLYDFHPDLFSAVDTPGWVSAAADAGFTGVLHPYVQTPLWAWMLQPVCSHMTFGAFAVIFLCIGAVSLAAMIEIVARSWACNFLRPLPLSFLLLATAISTPFQYAMWLMQTHALFLVLTVMALALAERGRAVTPGALLAAACAVKITPGFLLLYWFVGGRFRAAFWFVVFSLILAAMTVAAAGSDLMLAYVQSMRRVSNVLLVAYNNQSLAAWLGYSSDMRADVGNWRMLPLSAALKFTSLAAAIIGVALSGWMSRRHAWRGAATGVALISITICTPIAWTHYFVSLIPAVMVLTNAGGVLPLTIAVATFILNARPIAIDPINPDFGSIAILRSHFFSAIILMIALILRCRLPERLRSSPRSA